MKKAIIALLALVAIGAAIYFFLFSGKPVDDFDDDPVPQEDTPAEVQATPAPKPKNPVKAAELKAIARPSGKESQEQFSRRLDTIVEVNRRELEECEYNVDRVFGQALDDDSQAIYQESSIVDILDDFDNMSLTPKSSARLLEVLSDDKIKKVRPDDLANKLKELRPCRPYKKMSFVHNLAANFKKAQWSEATKKRARDSICKYFDKELSDHTTISNLNMQAALLESMVTEGVFNKKYEERLLDYKDELEDAYDELLDKADELKEEQEEKGQANNPIPLDIIREEFKLAKKFRGGLSGQIGEMCTASR